jgi:translation initiation factor IF-3
LKDKKNALNDKIRAKTVQIITDEGENLGEMPLSEAKAMAKDKELDLMEI